MKSKIELCKNVNALSHIARFLREMLQINKDYAHLLTNNILLNNSQNYVKTVAASLKSV